MNNKDIYKMLLRALGYTLLASLVSITVNQFLLSIFVVVEDANAVAILSFIITLIFILFFCTMLIIKKIDDLNN